MSADEDESFDFDLTPDELEAAVDRRVARKVDGCEIRASGKDCGLHGPEHACCGCPRAGFTHEVAGYWTSWRLYKYYKVTYRNYSLN